MRWMWCAVGLLACLGPASNATLLQADEPVRDRNRFQDGLGATEEVEAFIRSFPGRGAVGDDSSPTPAAEAAAQFQTADGLEIELVAAEPDVMQPLFLHFDARGRMWVVQYLQYPFPAGLKVVRYDQHLRAVFDQVPQPPPNHVPGADKITVFEDSNGDGRYDHSRDVLTGLNIATSVTTGGGGIWVLNPPYLLFYPDADGDGVPDGDPETHLSGFGLEDTHSVANSLQLGPDGWLYGANGSTTTATISSAASRNVSFQGQCIWRYHPKTRIFEIYAEGGGNTFSLEFDGKGRVFSGTNYGGTRGMFYPQGSYGVKGWAKHGPLTNPYAFGWFEHMRHEGDADRFPQTFCIYEGDSLPADYRGNIIAANALHNRVWASTMSADGSTFRTVDRPAVATTPDRWFRPVDVKAGPDGAVYVADWYDTRLTHVDPRDNWHKTSGRIYRIRGTDSTAGGAVNLAALSDRELLAVLTHPNKWHRQTAVRLLGERAGEPLRGELEQRAMRPEDGALEALWALHWRGWYGPELALKLLDHPDEHVRRWTVRLIGDARQASPELSQRLAALAATESYVQVRSQLASTAKRLPPDEAAAILAGLIRRSEDAGDPHLPLLIWWAIEAHCGDGRDAMLALLETPEVWDLPIVRQTVLRRLMQRFALQAVTARNEAEAAGLFAVCSQLLEMAPTPEHQRELLQGFLEAFSGREVAGVPESLTQAIRDYQQASGAGDLVLAIRLGQPDGMREALRVIADEGADRPLRLQLIDALGETPQPEVAPVLMNLLGSPAIAIKRAALMALMAYDDPAIGDRIAGAWHANLPDEQDLHGIALRVLGSRVPWSGALLRELEESRIKPEAVTLDVVQQMRLHGDADLDRRIERFWGRTRATPAEKQAQIERLAGMVRTLREGTTEAADDRRGRVLFQKHCGVCHTLFGEGGQTGPNLTGYQRDNPDFLLVAIVDPSAAIREEFTQFAIATHDGRVLNGLIDEQSPTTVRIRGANNQTTVLNRDDIEDLQALRTSIMPDGILDPLPDEDVLDLLAFVMRRTPPEPGATEAAAAP
ncbi:MAG: c-type cytochrome [Planctomyces sp.]|nr:c-type cytochrome [Planctomyces sp.]